MTEGNDTPQVKPFKVGDIVKHTSFEDWRGIVNDTERYEDSALVYWFAGNRQGLQLNWFHHLELTEDGVLPGIARLRTEIRAHEILLATTERAFERLLTEARADVDAANARASAAERERDAAFTLLTDAREALDLEGVLGEDFNTQYLALMTTPSPRNPQTGARRNEREALTVVSLNT